MIKLFTKLTDTKKNIIILMTGTAVAQAIPIAISPILTRIYTPEDFGVYALFISIVYILGSFISAKYELAIMLPKKDEDAINLFALGFIIISIISIILLLFILFFGEYFIKYYIKPNEYANIDFWLYFIPLALFFTGFYNIIYYFNNRKQNYKDLRNSTIIKSIFLAIIQISIGLIYKGATGLISGQIISQIISNIKLFKNVITNKDLISNISIIKIIALAKRYKKFPLYVTIGSLFDNLARNLITILISIFYGLSISGFYSISKRVMDLPIAFAGDSIKQIFFKEAIKIKFNTKETTSILIYTLKYLIIIGLFFFGSLYFIVEDLFAMVFGEDWRIAGIYTKILIPLFFVRFIVETIMPIDTVMEKQKYYFIFNLILLLASIIIIFFIQDDFELFLKCYVYTLSFIYILYGFVLYKFSKGKVL